MANDLADTWAAKGRQQHLPQATGVLAKWAADIKLYTDFLTQTAAALAVWAEKDTDTIDWRTKKDKQQPTPPPPPQGRRGYQHPRFPTVEVPAAVSTLRLAHRWRQHVGSDQIRCTQCLGLRKRGPPAECAPERHWVNSHNFNNHEIAIFETSRDFHVWACLRCGGWAETLPRLLEGYCLGVPTAFTQRDLTKLLGGTHPKWPQEAVWPVSWEAVARARLDAAIFEDG